MSGVTLETKWDEHDRTIYLSSNRISKVLISIELAPHGDKRERKFFILEQTVGGRGGREPSVFSQFLFTRHVDIPTYRLHLKYLIILLVRQNDGKGGNMSFPSDPEPSSHG